MVTDLHTPSPNHRLDHRFTWRRTMRTPEGVPFFGRNGRNTIGHGRERMTVREGAPMSDSVSRCANLSRCCQDELQYAPATNLDHTTVCKQR